VAVLAVTRQGKQELLELLIQVEAVAVVLALLVQVEQEALVS
jgi:hypothetical protein